MIPIEMKVRGITVLKDVHLDFSKIPGSLVAITGANGCLTGSTLIDMPRNLITDPGGIPLRDLEGKEVDLYCYDPKTNQIRLSKGINIRKTGDKVPVYKVTFTTRSRKFGAPKYLIGTLDHPVMLLDGSYKSLGDLRNRDRLKPLYRRLRDGDYASILQPNGKLELEHRLIAKYKLGRELSPSEEGHHGDLNALNNEIKNINPMDGGDHSSLHCYIKGPPHYDVHPRGNLGHHHSDEVRARIAASVTKSKAIAKGTWNHSVIKMAHFIGLEDVYDIEVPEFHNFVANGVVVHNSGKTSLMESVFASLYRQFPSRPSVYDFCHGRDAMANLKFDWHGRSYESVVNIDADFSKMEAFIYDDQHNPLPGITGKTKDFDAVVSRMFGSADMVMASSFAAQNKRGSFIKLAKIERKSLFIKMLNLELLQLVTEECRKELQKSNTALTAKRAEASSIQDQINIKVPEIADLRLSLAAFEADYLRLTNESNVLMESIGTLKSKVSGLKQLQDLLAEETKKYTGFTDKIRSLNSRLADNQKIIESADRIQKAVDELVVLRQDKSNVHRELGQLNVQRHNLQLEKEEYDKQVSAMREQWLRLQSTKKLCEKSIADAQLAAATIDEVPCKAEGEFAKCQFLVRATEAKESLDTKQVDLLNTTQQMLKIQDDQKLIPKPKTELIANYEIQIRELENRLLDFDLKIKSCEAVSALSGQIEQAKAKVEEIREQLAAAEESVTLTSAAILKAREETSALAADQNALTKSQNNLSRVEDDKNGVSVYIRQAIRDISNAEALQQARELNVEKIIPIRQEISELEKDCKEWNLLTAAFGPTGIQSLEIDAAGPTVSSLVNDLLFSCYGPRFSIKFVTQALKADGMGYRDEFDIVVIDADKSREGSIDGYSGGEQVVLGEAIGLAISIFNKMKSGISWESLFRDETTGPLDDVYAPRYIEMLRRAREIGKFKKVYFICHQDRLKDLSDATIEISNGEIIVNA